MDSTRRGKSMPDALSKTVPIWCAVINRLAFPEYSAAWELHTPSQVVGTSEHAQIETRLDKFFMNIKVSSGLLYHQALLIHVLTTGDRARCIQPLQQTQQPAPSDLDHARLFLAFVTSRLRRLFASRLLYGITTSSRGRSIRRRIYPRRQR